jgi:hypothetical protein
MKFEALIRAPTAWTSVASRFAVHLFEGHVTLTDMNHMLALGKRWNAEHPETRVELVVVYPSDARMSHDERVHMARVMKLGEARRVCSATVILAEGLRASVQRSVLTCMTMLAPPPHPAKVFDRTADAAHWLLPYVCSVHDAALSLDGLMRALCAHLSDFQRRPDRPRFGANADAP